YRRPSPPSLEALSPANHLARDQREDKASPPHRALGKPAHTGVHRIAPPPKSSRAPGSGQPWTVAPGSPETQQRDLGARPTVAVTGSQSRATVYASWNGATEVSSWVVLGGSHAGHLEPTSRGHRTRARDRRRAPDAA